MMQRKTSKYPVVRFETDQMKDVETFFDFVREAAYDDGRTIEWAILSVAPELHSSFNGTEFVGTRAEIEALVRVRHEENRAVIEERLAQYERKWQEASATFFDLTEEVFGNRPWPKGKYIAYPTMWGMYPRFLEDKTFQLPYSNDEECARSNEIIAHEMVHFIYYDYFFETYPEYAHEDKELFAWHVTEIFNAVIQGTDQWDAMFHCNTNAYPEHEEIVAELVNKFPQVTRANLIQLTEEIIKSVTKSNLPKDC